MQVKHFFDSDSHTISYVVYDKVGGHSAVIDPVLDWNNKNYTTDTKSADGIIAFIKENNLKNQWILETHMHADHISGARYVKKLVGGNIAIGKSITVVQGSLRALFNLGDTFVTDGSNFDYLFEDNEVFSIGNLKARAVHVPGHTPADMMYEINGSLFVGDTIFMPDVGTARCDFPGGDASVLWDSIQKILSYPSETVLYLCHDYFEDKKRGVSYMVTVGEQRQSNIHVAMSIDKTTFLDMRKKRDATLDLPTYIFPAMHINARAGMLPQGEGSSSMRYIKIPINWWGSDK